MTTILVSGTDTGVGKTVVTAGIAAAAMAGGARVGVLKPAESGIAPDAGVISVTAPEPEAAVAWAAACLDRGVAVGCFRPPSTPDSRSRLRLTVNVGVPRADFEHALDIIAECAP